MNNGNPLFWRKYLANAELDMSVAAYTKVPQSWNEDDFTPDFNKFYYVTEGEGYLKIKDKLFSPKPGDLYLMPAGVLQSYGTVSDNTFGKYWCHFTAKLGGISLFQMVQAPVHIAVTEHAALVSIFERLIRHDKSDQLTSAFHVNAALLELIAFYIEQSGEIKLNLRATSAIEKLDAVLRYIEQRLAEEINVSELAKIAHLHPNYFIRVFKDLTGFTPIQYINRQRMDKAKHLLLATELNISQIADAVGIGLFYFSRMFQEQTGMSPTTFRGIANKRVNSGYNAHE